MRSGLADSKCWTVGSVLKGERCICWDACVYRSLLTDWCLFSQSKHLARASVQLQSPHRHTNLFRLSAVRRCRLTVETKIFHAYISSYRLKYTPLCQCCQTAAHKPTLVLPKPDTELLLESSNPAVLHPTTTDKTNGINLDPYSGPNAESMPVANASHRVFLSCSYSIAG